MRFLSLLTLSGALAAALMAGCTPAAAPVPTEVPATAQVQPTTAPTLPPPTEAPEAAAPEPRLQDTPFEIDGQFIVLTDGVHEREAAPGSAQKITTSYFGNEAFGDLNGDGQADGAFLVSQSGAGSGTFYYVVVALRTADGYQATNAILLGDRIAPQTTQIQDGALVVNYADRKPDEPFSVAPSVGVSRYFTVTGGVLMDAPTP